MTTTIAFFRQNDVGSRVHYLVLRKSRTRSLPRLRTQSFLVPRAQQSCQLRRLHSNNLNSLVHGTSTWEPDLKWNITWNILCPQILREVPASEIVLTQCVMSRSGRMLFAGTSSGTLRAMKFPLTVPGEWQEHQVHSGAITKVRNLVQSRAIMLTNAIGTVEPPCPTTSDRLP